MDIEFSTSTETAPVEVLDTQVTLRATAGHSLLSLRFLYRKNREADHLSMPPLSWFDASQLQRFSLDLAKIRQAETCTIDLPDAGIRLIGSTRRIGGRWTAGRTIQVEPLPTSERRFMPFTIHGSQHDITSYARTLYNRLWEVFIRG
ncbi:hypothetical protein DYU11_08590 [Fibrisoma montanum]|uniref:Uncharacterized protein n=1 Tax=Fibrisoma montanum TaxID=2305895 RepID=A0A418MEY8_9BACT|nr:hypothetical protein [Fibrisoma montanum]RIV25351.1 hypothetical protein DYU11_08590 [Fibrisoma montanum]